MEVEHSEMGLGRVGADVEPLWDQPLVVSSPLPVAWEPPTTKSSVPKGDDFIGRATTESEKFNPPRHYS